MSESGPSRGKARTIAARVLSVAVVAASAAGIYLYLDGRQGSAVARSWARAVRTGGVEDRLDAARFLGGTGPEDASVAIPALDEATRDGEEAVSVMAVRTLGDLGARSMKAPGGLPEARMAADALVRALGDRREVVRVQAAVMLRPLARPPEGSAGSPIDSEIAIPALIALAFGDPSDQARLQATNALLPVAARSPLPPPAVLYETLATSKSSADRDLAASVLGAFPIARASTVAALVAALEDRDPRARRGAALALRGAGKDGRPALAALIAELREPPGPDAGPAPTSPRVRLDWWLPGITGKYPDSATLVGPKPERAGGEDDPASKAAGAIGAILAATGPFPGAVEALAGAIRSGPPGRREAAEYALAEIGAMAGPAIPDLIACLTEAIGLDNPGFGSGSARALGKAAPGTDQAGRAIEVLARALDARSGFAGLNSIEALGRFGPDAKAALPRLKEKLKSKWAPEAEAARKAISLIEASPSK